jgi:hypothetical protein
MEIVFKRRLTNELLTTYLPTFLLLGITYSTTFFKPFFFEAALTVNLTAMLVITTLFIRFVKYLQTFAPVFIFTSYLIITLSVMEKLPPTSYVRMVDVWLIFGQLIPFVEVSLLTIIEYYNDDRDDINHHGTSKSLVAPVPMVRHAKTHVPISASLSACPLFYLLFVILVMSSLLCRLCYVHCRTKFFHVDIFPFLIFMSHVYFRF